MAERIWSVSKKLQPPHQPTGGGRGYEDEGIKREARRRFAKAGLLAPIVVTLASRPAWGINSGHLSGNVSNAPNNMNGLGMDNLGADPYDPYANVYDPYGLNSNDTSNASDTSF